MNPPYTRVIFEREGQTEGLYEEPNELELTIFKKRGLPARVIDPQQLNSPDILDGQITDTRTVPQSDEQRPHIVTSPRASILELLGRQGESQGGTDLSRVIQQIYPQLMEIINANTQGGNSTPNWGDLFSRLSIYLSVGPLAQSLFDFIYGNVIEFIKRPPGTGSPLDEYIISYDQIMSDEGLVRAVGSRVGIYIPIDSEYWAREIFVDKIVEVIENLNLFEPDTTLYPPGPHGGPAYTLQEMIDIDRPPFYTWLKKQGVDIIMDDNKEKTEGRLVADQLLDPKHVDTVEQMYQNRLLTFIAAKTRSR